MIEELQQLDAKSLNELLKEAEFQHSQRKQTDDN